MRGATCPPSRDPSRATNRLAWMKGSAPRHGHFVGPVPLVDEGLTEFHSDPAAMHLQPGPCDHRPVVDAQIAGWDEHPRPAVGGHSADHLLETPVPRDAAAEEDFVV